MMKSRVQSNIHLLTAKAPSAKVQCHRTPNGSHSSLTNAFLKKGGALPSVLPVDVAELPCKSKQPNESRNQPPVVLKRRKSDNTKQQPSPTRRDNHLHACQLEKKMEHLSSKLTKVQDILESHLMDAADPAFSSGPIEQEENERFSARDYMFLLLETNGSIPSLPYDPTEFSEKTFRQRLT